MFTFYPFLQHSSVAIYKQLIFQHLLDQQPLQLALFWFHQNQPFSVSNKDT